MRLKSLEIQGYKSFANKVEFAFDDGITAVVGPNGSGKSNVADAIRWVLGEQSYSNLRGKKTEDMIFSGSDGRARLGLASVTLVLDNTDKWLPLDFSEVTISRRAYRSGENEYFLNGSRVRLKDVAELLSKSGLSRQTYTVIGQGTIDRVLSLHAEERRKLFEEAAGITFHRQKRAETLAKLEATRANLLRVNDIVKEIEPRMQHREKQAQRAQEHNLLRTHLDGLLRVWYGFRWGQGQQQLREAKLRLRDGENMLKNQREQFVALEQEISRLRLQQTELRGNLGSWYAENNRRRSQTEAIQRELAVSEERARQYLAQREEIMAELGPLSADLEVQTRQLAEAENALQAVNQELSQAEAAMRVLQQQLDGQQRQRQELLNRQAAAEKQAGQLAHRLAEHGADLVQFEERRAALLADQANYETEISRLTQEQQELQGQQAQLTSQLAELEADLTLLDGQQVQQRDRLSQLDEAAEQLKNRMASLQRQEDTLKARQDWLGKLRSEMSGYFEGVKAVLQPEAGLSGIIGTVSQAMQVPPDLEGAIEAALGSRLQEVVAQRFADAEAAIAYLKESRSGRATFLPLDTLRPGPALSVPNTPGIVGLASDLVTVEPHLRPVAEATLNRTLIVEDLPAARRAFNALSGGFQIVTREGELMRSGGSVTGGRDRRNKGQEGTLLTREREWRELPGQLAEIAAAFQTLSSQLAGTHEQAAEVKRRVQQLAEEQRQKATRRQELQGLADKLSRALEQAARSVGWQRELQEKAEAELARLEQRQADTRQEMAQLEQQRQAAAETARQLAEEAGAFAAETLLAELSQARAAVATLQGRQRSQQALLTSQQAARQQLARQIDSKQARANTLAAEREFLWQQQQDLLARSQESAGEQAEFTSQIEATEQELAQLLARQTHLEESESHLRLRLQRTEAEHNRLALEAARRQDELDNLQRQIQDDLGLVSLEMSEEQVGQPVLPIRPLVSDLPVVEALPPGVEEDVLRLKVQLRRLGNINPDAPREYAELRERYNFLTGQMADLEEAAADLKEVILKLDQAMEEAFTATFQQVAKEFQRYFKALFGGGEAQLLLTDPDNMIDTGVDIAARPPGKRLQSLALLSGGERSLTAQALIFALLKISPTPFVIFDEVDAMLDEANVGRFRDALTALAHDIQFIVITHNRKTIEAARTLYGISMGDDSVSQVYSLKIDEWIEEKVPAAAQ
ncbi:MAG: chromosome segregation protein SMC [Anaerolineae bacterium]